MLGQQISCMCRNLLFADIGYIGRTMMVNISDREDVGEAASIVLPITWSKLPPTTFPQSESQKRTLKDTDKRAIVKVAVGLYH